MDKAKTSLSKRLVAGVLSVLMLLGVMPTSAITAFAADQDHPDDVTITVLDEAGKPVPQATVQYTIDSAKNGAGWKTGTQQTNSLGCVPILKKDEFVAGDATLTVSVSKDGFTLGENIIVKEPITSGTQNFNVKLIRDVIVTGNELTYTGKPQTLVTVAAQPGDVLTYKINGQPSERPEAVDANRYNVTVTVTRGGTELFDRTAVVIIKKADLAVNVAARSLTYNEKDQVLVDVQGEEKIPRDAAVQWYLDGAEYSTNIKDVPKAQTAGEHTVRLTAKLNNPNYNDVDIEQTVTIQKASLNLEGLTVQGLSGVYRVDEQGTPVAQKAVEVKMDPHHPYTLKYQLSTEDVQPDEKAWVDEIPTVTDAGSYIVWVKAVKDGYKDEDVPVVPGAGAVAPFNVYVAKAEQSISFLNYKDKETTTVSFDEQDAQKNVYRFGAKGGIVTDSPITYTLENATEDETDVNQIAKIDNDGTLTVLAQGAIKIIATRKGNGNYQDATVEHILVVVKNEHLVTFDQPQVKYVLGENKDIASDQQARKTNADDNGKITYEIGEGHKDYLSIDHNGQLKVTDYGKLAAAMDAEKNKTLTVTVRAKKTEGTKRVFDWHKPGYVEKVVYASESTSYHVEISFLTTPAETYEIQETPTQHGWYGTAIHVNPKQPEAYQISRDLKTFAASTMFEDQGAGERYIYLRDITTGGITNKILLQGVKIDTEVPDPQKMSIEIQDLNIVEKLGVKFGFYNPSVKIRFIVADELGQDESGLDYMEWSYTREEKATDSILEQKSGTLKVNRENDRYVAMLEVKATEVEQYRGHIAFRAVDKAGGKSNFVKKDDVVIVVDTINPKMSAEFHVADTQNGIYQTEVNNGVTRHYFNGDVEFVFTVKEANFFADNIKITVSRNEQPYEAKVKWSVDASDKETHYGKFQLQGDGDYVVTMTYKDESNNVMCDSKTSQEVKEYTSDVITIDTKPPQIQFEFDKAAQKTKFTITEHNFRAADIVVTGVIRDITGNNVPGVTVEDIARELQDQSKWIHGDGDTYTFESNRYADGIYELEIGYKGLAGNQTTVNEKAHFLIDHNGPTHVEITYSKPIGETVRQILSLGFYNPKVEIYFSATDTNAGVDSFIWSYTRQAGQSEINRPTDTGDKVKNQVVKAHPDKNDGSKFVGSTTLVATEKELIRGYITVQAKDKYGNSSKMVADKNHILVVDVIDPQRRAEFSKPVQVIGDRAYYKGDVTVTFTVEESNFFEEDFHVMIRKNGQEPQPVELTWEHESVDVHKGTYTLSGDGDYEVSAEYTDRSQNKMDSYVSHPFTIDTHNPNLSVTYADNGNYVRTLADREGHNRDYYKGTRTATINIVERNFNADDVKITLTAQDAAGTPLNAEDLIEKTEWSAGDAPDEHIMKITYSGEGNYTFDVEYADLANNGANPHPTDYFTVDRTSPTGMQISYSQSVLDTILESISFGFYRGKVQVTISAEDSISGVNGFRYSYRTAPGVSDVNAGLADQLIDASGIRYSENGKTATAVFEIPKDDLDYDHQFNGTVDFTAVDRADNNNEKNDTKRIVVDNIAPNAQVSYNQPVNVAEETDYYSGDIHATITVNEANFYAEDVRVTVTKDKEEPVTVTPVWTDSSVDVHVGSFTLSGDGEYVVTVDCSDKSGNGMATYTSRKMIIDTDIQMPQFTINGVPKTEEGGAYKGDATIGFSYQDQNFAGCTVRLTRTRFDRVEDVTGKFIRVSDTEQGGHGSFSIPKEVENDGVYLLTVSMTDKANHTVESKMKFSINRYGSVYEYGRYLVSLIQDGGQFIKSAGEGQPAITQDLVITEYNVNQILADSLKIMITRDGEAVEAKYTTNPTIDANAKSGENGWYRYVYTIAKENFVQDGTYKITLSSQYASSDSAQNESASIPENSVDSEGNRILDTINFTVDTTAPEIRNVVNLDRAVVNAQTLDVGYTVVDVGGLKSVEVIVNGETVETVTEFGDNLFNYSGTFKIHESSDAQTVQIKVTDRAGNVTDTAAENFSTGGLYVFNDTLTVSTNFLVRWYANRPLFWGSICVMAVLAAGICVVIVYVRKKKKEDE